MQSCCKKKIGQLLCERSYLVESALEDALDRQKQRYHRLGQILLELGHITKRQLTEVLASQAGIQRAELEDISPSRAILDLIPAELVSKYSVLPLEKVDGQISVAMSQPFETRAIETRVRLRGNPCFP